MKIYSEILASILTRNDLVDADGRMLCKYRCSESEYEILQEELRETIEITQGILPQSSSASFCLYASEWWRKNYDSGPWSWNGILVSLGLDENYNRAELYEPIRKGLKFWKRNLLTVGVRNAYFVTLACEGGLPLKIIHREQNSYLQHYLKALLNEFRVYGNGESSSIELASRVGSRLPKGLRQKPLFQLCGELIGQVWCLQHRIGDTSTPIEDLDRTLPDWRESFPLVVTDEAAKALLNSLINDAVKIARIQEIKISTILKKVGASYQIERKIQIPPSFDTPSLADQLKVPVHQLPYNVQLYLCQQSYPRQLLALITRRTAGEDGRFAAEIATNSPNLLSGDRAANQLWLEARSNNLARELRNIKGSLGLSNLPWVFSDKEDRSDQWVLIGEGSLKTKYPFAIVAAPPDSKVKSIDGLCEHLIDDPHLGRAIYRISGAIIVTDDVGVTTISTKAAEEEHAQFSIFGEFFSHGIFGSNIYKGVPRIICYPENGLPFNVPEAQLQWKTRKGNDSWKSDLNRCFGPVTIRLVKKGETHFLANIDVVPKGGNITFKPGRNSREGAIEISGMDALRHGCVSDQSSVKIETSLIPGGVKFECFTGDDPPVSLNLYIRWELDQEMVLTVPYPTRGVRYINRNGTVLRTDDIIHRTRMSGVTVQVMDVDPGATFSIEAIALSKRGLRLNLDSIKLDEVAPGRHEIDLRQLQDGCNLLFSAVEDLDAMIKVGVISNTSRTFPQRIYVARYDIHLHPDKETGEAYISDNDLMVLNGDSSQLQLKTFPLTNPEQEYEVLPANSLGRWQFYKEERTPGPWLVTGWDGDWCRLRPLCWTVFEENTTTPEDSSEISFESVAKIINTRDRSDSYDRLLTKLSADPNHNDWNKINACFNHLQHLPATTFDIVGRLARHPDAAAMVLLKAGGDSFDEVWNNLERLPFAWYLVPISSWMNAAIIQEQNLRTALAPLSESFGGNVESMIESSFKTFFNQVPIRQPGMQPLVELARHKLFNTLMSELRYLPMFTNSPLHIMRETVLVPAEQELLQLHADDRWPTCPEIQEEWGPSVHEIIPEDLHSLWNTTMTAPEFRLSILNAPIAAAFCAAFNIKLNKRMVFNIRKLREFDLTWFNVAYGYALASSIGYCLRNNQEF